MNHAALKIRPQALSNAVKKMRVLAVAPELLESRVLMSGTVSAVVSHGNLIVRGDKAAEAIVLDQAGLTTGQVRLTGNGGTAINGQADPLVVSGITGDVRIRMGNAADRIAISNMSLPGNLTINAGAGENDLALSNVQVRLNLHMATGSDPGTTTMANTTVGEQLIIVNYSGGQTDTFQSVDVGGTAAVVSFGKGADTMAIDDSTFRGPVQLRTGEGNDTVSIDASGAPLGQPTVFEGNTLISLRGGNDVLQLGVNGQTGNRSEFASQLFLGGGSGMDTLLDFDSAKFDGGAHYTVHNFESNAPAPDMTPPTVSSTNPANAAAAVALNKRVAVTFSEAMDPASITAANITLTAPNSVPVMGTVTYVGITATFRPAAALTPNTQYTLTIGTGVTDLAGNHLSTAFVSGFTTGLVADTTDPTVSSTSPAAGATGVPVNQRIAATFSEAMDPLTITAANVSVAAPGNVAVAGTVSYAGTTMTFMPTRALAASTAYTVTITTGATDLAGNPLAANYVWSFTTGALADTTAPTVTSTNPANLQTNVFINMTVAGTFSESMNALTITTATFHVTGPGTTPVTGTVSYDAPSDTAIFTPSANLAPNTTFTATLSGGANGVTDLAGNPLAVDKVWTFTTGTQVAQATINLGAASSFAVIASASITNTGPSVINGDVGLNPGSSQGIPPSDVNGSIHVDDQAAVAAQSSLLSAYNDAVSRTATSVSLQGNLGGLTFTPGLYTNSSTVMIQGSGPLNNVTLDAQGDPNAVFIFKIGSTLTTGPGAQVILAGGAKASNVFWQVGTSATLNTTTIFKGSILAAISITVDTGSNIEGRLLGGSTTNGSVSIDASTVTVPTP